METRGLATAVGMLGCWLAAVPVFVPILAPASADPISAGVGKQMVNMGGTPVEVFTYRPTQCSDPSLLLVFHGAARDAEDYRDYARPLADRLCMLVVAPLLDRKRFPSWRYQRGGIVDAAGAVQNPRDFTGRLVLDLVDWARQQEGRNLPYSLIAHSAGGQFLGRVVAFVPNEARRVVIANPGTYVMPSLAVDAPYGLGKAYSAADGEDQLRRYLQQPLTIYLGEADDRDDDRNNAAQARAQGASRHARGLNAFNAARSLAQARGWTFNWRLIELPGVGHDARKMLSAPQASQALLP
jgi:alpha-beta hydrolase superfamily lysophospholipase